VTGADSRGLIGHQVQQCWMGAQILTLADLIPPNPRVVCIGINPSPVSVQVGHYYQGRFGQRIFARLREAGLIADPSNGYEDDDAFGHGVGFTDIVKRPTIRATSLHPQEYAHGRELLADRIDTANASLVVFTSKRAATAYFGNFTGGGLVPGLRLGGAEVFVLPGPMESTASAAQKIIELRSRLRQ
jgi:TDG/mug DNA glycosylase family protein